MVTHKKRNCGLYFLYTFFGVEITKVLDKEDGVDPSSQKIYLESFAPTDFCVSTDASNISVVECSTTMYYLRRRAFLCSQESQDRK